MTALANLSTRGQIERFITALFKPDDMVEVRLLPAGEKAWGKPAEIVQWCDRLAERNGSGENIYFGVHPRKRHGSSSSDGVKLARALFADFDGVELCEVLRRIDEAVLPVPTIIVESGHGVHVYWLFEQPIEDLDQWRRRQQAIIAAVKSDPSVHDPPRIMRLPGFLNVKDEPVPCRLIECDPARLYALEEFPEPAVEERSSSSPVGDVIAAGGRNMTMFSIAGSLRRRGLGENEIRDALEAINTGGRVHPPLEADELERIAAGICRYPPGGERRHLTEDGNALRFVDRYGEIVRYCDLWGKWLIWDGKRWAIDEVRAIEALGADVLRSIYREAANEDEGERRKRIAEWAARSEAAPQLARMLSLVRHRVPARPDDFDGDPWLLTVNNGTLDLRSGELREHRREDRITRLGPVDFDPDASSPRWTQFLERIMAGNRRLIDFLRRVVGYSLTGSTTERCLFILHGSGANGKTTFLETLREGILGDYALRTPAATLLAKRDSSIPNDVARLRGARFVTASETEDGRRMAEAFVKDVTGGDTISARFMRAEWFDFRPECKVFLATNHKPTVRGTDDAIWSRIRLIPFEVSIPEHERDPQLRDKLIGEAAGIFAWAVRGCLEWQAGGLQPPDEILQATGSYREEMDVLGAFLVDCCDTSDPEAEASSADLYRAYKAWCDDAGEKAVTQTSFGNRLRERGFKSVLLRTGRKGRRGLRLVASS